MNRPSSISHFKLDITPSNTYTAYISNLSLRFAFIYPLSHSPAYILKHPSINASQHASHISPFARCVFFPVGRQGHRSHRRSMRSARPKDLRRSPGRPNVRLDMFVHCTSDGLMYPRHVHAYRLQQNVSFAAPRAAFHSSRMVAGMSRLPNPKPKPNLIFHFHKQLPRL